MNAYGLVGEWELLHCNGKNGNQ